MYLFGLTGSDEDIRQFAKIDGLIAIAHHGEVTDCAVQAGETRRRPRPPETHP